MTVKEIIEKYLKDNGYDGLYSEEYGCEIGEMFPCSREWILSCKPGYKAEANDSSGWDYYICPSKEDVRDCEIEEVRL